MKKTIKVQGSKYPIKFGYGAFRILGDAWGCSGVQGVAKRVQELFSKSSEDISFEQADALGDIALAGIENAGGDAPERDDIVHEIMFEDSSNIEIIMNAFSDSFPKGNPNPVKKAGKKTAKK